jgi:hypothetical protein
MGLGNISHLLSEQCPLLLFDDNTYNAQDDGLELSQSPLMLSPPSILSSCFSIPTNLRTELLQSLQ